MIDNQFTDERTAVVVGPHPVCHEGLRTVLALVGVRVVATGCDFADAPRLADRTGADLLVADIGSGANGDALAHVREAVLARPALVVVALGDAAAPELEAAFAAGVAGVVAKTAHPEQVAIAIRHALDGTTYVVGGDGDGGFVANVRPAAPDDDLVPAVLGRPRLTRRELEVLQLAAAGRSNRDVAKLLWVTDQTVKFHLANVYRKLGVSNRFEAARWARANGLLETPVEEAFPRTARRAAVAAAAALRRTSSSSRA